MGLQPRRRQARWVVALVTVTAALAMALAALEPPLPQPMGVLRAVQRPTVDALAREQEEEAARKRPPDLEALLHSGDVWTVAA